MLQHQIGERMISQTLKVLTKDDSPALSYDLSQTISDPAHTFPSFTFCIDPFFINQSNLVMGVMFTHPYNLFDNSVKTSIKLFL